MIKRRIKQVTDSQKSQKCQRLFSHFLLVEAEAIGVEAEAVAEIAASTSLAVALTIGLLQLGST